VGSCRGPADEERIRTLQEQAAELGLEQSLEWCVNASHDDVRRILGGAIGGLHSMLDEHFGISVVEYMAAGEMLILVVFSVSSVSKREVFFLACMPSMLGEHIGIKIVEYMAARLSAMFGMFKLS
jgi:hypothetical protein